MSKTQILITDIGKDKFENSWADDLRKMLFEREFLTIRPEYFTPLPFLNRIVIIFRNEDDALKIYEYLQKYLLGTKVKLCLTESLIGKTRSASADLCEYDNNDDTTRHMTVDTSIDNSKSESICNSSSLSPDLPISVTKLKFPDDPHVRYYKEPAPEKLKLKISDDKTNSNLTHFLYKSKTSDDLPPSPSIVLNEFQFT